MARNEVGEVVNIAQTDVVQAELRGNPIKDIRDRFKKNIHFANRVAKKQLVREVKNKLEGGVPGEGYHPDYAERKTNDPRNDTESNANYNQSGPVDFNYSGRLWNQFLGRGRAKPSELVLQSWIGLRNPNRGRPQSAPGTTGTTYRQLVRILRGQKPGTDGNPISPSRKGRQRTAQAVADALLGGSE
jgi:hypothetical protein